MLGLFAYGCRVAGDRKIERADSLDLHQTR